MKTLPFPLVLRRLATILAVITLTLSLIAAATGILLAFYYEPTAGGAYNSLRSIATDIPNGTLIRSLHDIAGNGVIGVALVEIVVMYLGRKFSPSWLSAWVSGILLTLVCIGLSWTAIILDWSQVGYWRFRIELGTIEAIPAIGETLRNILTGGSAVDTITVQHLYALHSYILAAAAVGLAIAHLVAILYAARSSQLQIEDDQSELEQSGAVNS